MKYRISAFIIIALLFAGCNNKNSLRIEGTINNRDKSYIFLNRVDVDTPIRLDSVKVKSNGTFRFKIEATETDFYQIGLSTSDFVTVLADPGEKIKLKFNGKYLFDNYEVSGSPGSEKIKMLDSMLAITKGKIDSLKAVYEKSIDKPDFTTTEQTINQEFVKILKAQRFFNIDFILKNLSSMATIKALYQRIDESTYVLYDSRDLQFLKLASDTLSKYYPNAKQTKALKINFEKEMNRMFLNKIDQLTKNIPETRIDPDLKDVNGRRVKLSSLTGKYVLLSFWSAGSGDCLAENLQLKDYYKKYRNRGFEIYQINLDLNEETWKKAVAYDELPWISVREDDPTSPRFAQLYNVRVLPANYLYDKTGNITGTDLHGKSLQVKLAQLFGN